jgi:pimeloyl-ACP methyl ester carboxylesterase
MRSTHRWALGIVGAGLALGAAVALANRALRLDDLPPTLPGSMHDWTWRGRRVRYTRMGSGPPLVLVHGIHAAASSFEMRNVFEPLSQRYTVYALDLLGFGKSERPSAPYNAWLYQHLLGDFIAEVVGRPAVVVASSLSSAHAVAVARTRTDLVERLVLLSPTGITSKGPLGRAFGRLLALPLIGSAAFNLLVSRPSIRWFLKRAYADDGLVDDPLLGQQWATAHQPNARHAPAAFLAGRLDLPLGDRAPRLRAPVLVLRGSRQGIGRGAADADLRGLSPSVTIRTIDGAGQLPHDEAPDRVIELIESWLSVPGTEPAAAPVAR